MNYDAVITIRPVKGGFIVDYPIMPNDEGKNPMPTYVTEVAASLGKAMRVAKTAVEEFSLVAKDKNESE